MPTEKNWAVFANKGGETRGKKHSAFFLLRICLGLWIIIKKNWYTPIRKIRPKEMNIMIEKEKFEAFDIKWSNFKSIYDYCGPNIPLI